MGGSEDARTTGLVRFRGRTMKVKIGKTTLAVERGDITDAEVDAVVNAANSELWMGTGVAGSMKRKGGVVIEEEALRQGPIEIGEAVLTVAGNLPATHVIHAATMGRDLKTDPEKIAAATRSTLALAEKHKMESIAFPALGSGVGGVPPAQSADAILSTVVQHVARGNSSLQKVLFVLYQDEAYKAFTDTLKRLSPIK
jgi:O-acetyl-ADP-ribose deacetylase (regulator of RNase III)